MTLPAWRIEAIAKSHDRKRFDCGNDALNVFLQRYARQNHEQGGSKTFLAVEKAEPTRVLGFYSVAPSEMAHDLVPEIVRRGMPRHEVPGFRLPRLAIDVRVQGRGLGGRLLSAAARRCVRVATEVGGVMLIIDAKDERAAQWYVVCGASRLQDRPFTLVMPLAAFDSGVGGS